MQGTTSPRWYGAFCHPSKPIDLREAVKAILLLPLLLLRILTFAVTLIFAQIALCTVPNIFKGWFGRLYWRVHLWCFGFWTVRVVGEQDPRCKTIVSNHLSFSDIYAFSSVLGSMPSFLAKASLKVVPVLSRMMNVARCIFVERDGASRADAAKKLIARQRDRNSELTNIVFAEGLCTNGLALVDFKHGPFLAGVPVQPAFLSFENPSGVALSFWPSWDSVPVFPFILRQMWQWKNHLTVTFLEVVTPTEEMKRDPSLFASVVQAKMAKAMKVPIIAAGYPELKLFLSLTESGRWPVYRSELERIGERGLDERLTPEERAFLEGKKRK